MTLCFGPNQHKPKKLMPPDILLQHWITMDVNDLKDTVRQLLDDFRIRMSSSSVRCHEKAFEELTQKICMIMEVAKHRETLEYYKHAMLDDGTNEAMDIEFTPILKVE